MPTMLERLRRHGTAITLGSFVLLGSWPAGPCSESYAAGESAAPKPARATPRETPPYPALEALERELARLADSNRFSVVGVIARSPLENLLGSLGNQIQLDDKPGTEGTLARRIGSGVVIDAQGHIATLSSVVAGASEILVIPAQGKKLRARIRGMDEYSGVAVLSVEGGESLRPVRLGDASALKVGSFITAFSNPQGDLPAYSVGVVSGMGVSHGPLRRGPYLRLNAYAAPGAGGGPVMDSKGHMVGLLFGAGGAKGHATVITWDTTQPDGSRGEEADQEAEDAPEGEPDPEEPGDAAAAGGALAPFAYLRSLHRMGAPGSGVSYAVPVEVVRRVTEQIIRSGSVRRGWLGVTIESSDPGDIHLTRIIALSPADKAGLMVGDRILSLDGEPVGFAETLVEKLAVSSPGSSVRLGVQRGPRRLDVSLTLGESPQTPRPAGAHERRDLMRLRSAEAAPSMPPVPPGWPGWEAQRPRLGVILEEVDDHERRRQGAPDGVGLLVTQVQQDTRAAACGILSGDLLVEALGVPIRSIPDLRRVLRSQGPAREMEIKLLRNRKNIIIRVPPAPPEGPTPPAAPAPPAPRAPRKPG